MGDAYQAFLEKHDLGTVFKCYLLDSLFKILSYKFFLMNKSIFLS